MTEQRYTEHAYKVWVLRMAARADITPIGEGFQALTYAAHFRRDRERWDRGMILARHAPRPRLPG